MMTPLVTITLVIFVIILVFKGIRIVPQAENWIVETFGKYNLTLKPGLNLINPLFSSIAYKADIREMLLDLPEQQIISSDNATVNVDGVVFYKIMDPYKAYYGIQSLKNAIANLGVTTLRSIMGKLSLDESLFSRDRINAELLTVLDEATDAWGTKITRVEIKEILPHKDIIEAMSKQMTAERNRRATVLEAEAQKESQERIAEGAKKARILEAEARKESAFRDAEGRERYAQAESDALKNVAESLKQCGGDPVLYLLGQRYLEGIKELAASQNAKFVIMPNDLMDNIKGIFKSGK
ncbi:MAG: hypothetical protein A2096_06690 [Spirochaetes bacterium GWF1_41_5]|nr:MAG: hypothetical protein A2096_06690 [Spirochaetes bacterium GWF1_41_5]HBE01059.1 paraslipin [Spirochaetia bacterium]